MDVFTPQKRSAIMARIKPKDTKPELILRRLVWAAGLRYRLYKKIEGVRPDFVFSTLKIAVFVDGCFWHKCPVHCVMPKTNQLFWERKLTRNVERDRLVTELLVNAGWTVLRFWEHDIGIDPGKCVQHVVNCYNEKSMR